MRREKDVSLIVFFHCAKGRRLRSAPFLLYRHRMQGVISHISSMALAIFWLVVVSFAIGGMILGFRVGLARPSRPRQETQFGVTTLYLSASVGVLFIAMPPLVYR